MAEDDLANLAPVAPACWLYLVKKDAETAEILSALSLCDKECPTIVAPLLGDLTVEPDFVGTVRTPMSSYDGGVLTRVTSFCPFALLFYHTEEILSFVEDHGDVRALCEDARRRFGVRPFSPLTDRTPTDVDELCRRLDLEPSDTLGYVVCGNGLKEMLYAGQLVPCPEEAAPVRIRSREGLRLPLYPATLFVSDGGRGDDSTGGFDDASTASADLASDPFVASRGFYSPGLSETLYYFLFASWSQCLRVSDTLSLIDVGRRQFVDDSQLTAKLAAFKRYHGYGSQKLSPVERDQLMVIDVVTAELALSYSSVYFDSYYETGGGVFDFSEWPIVRSASCHAELMDRLGDLQTHLSTHVAAAFFANNSILYQTRIALLPAASAGGGGGGFGGGGGGVHGGGGNVYATRESLLKRVCFTSGLAAMYEDALSDSKKVQPFEGVASKDDAYSPAHLAYFCGTCPQLVSNVVWHFNRMVVYSTGAASGNVVYQHVVHSVSNLCEACGGRCCHTCYATAFVRVRSRLPQLPKGLKREPMVVSLLSRPFADVGLLGNFGRRFGPEPRDGGGDASTARNDDASVSGKGAMDGTAGGGGIVSASASVAAIGAGGGASGSGDGGVGGGGAALDRMRHMNQLLDYCKKNSLIDAATGEDVFLPRGKKDFIKVIGSLNRTIDEAACRFAGDVRAAGQGRDEIANCTQSFNLDLNPFALSFSPLLTYQYYRVVFGVLQNLALINAAGYVVDNPLTVPQVSRWVNQHFQVIAGAFAGTPLKKGFLHVRDTKILKSLEFEQLMDYRVYGASACYVKKSVSIKACKMSVRSLVSCRLKNRPVCKPSRGGAATYYKRVGGGGVRMSEAAAATQNSKRGNLLRGGLGFLLYRCHDRLFPDCGVSCLDLWSGVLHRRVPPNANVGPRDEFDSLVKFLTTASGEYDENDVVDTAPECIVSYVENRFHNRFLGMFGLRDYLITIQALGTRVGTQNRMNCPCLLPEAPKFESLADYARRFKELQAEGLPAPRAPAVRREPVLRHVFDNRSLVTVSLRLDKYAGGMGSRDIFQFGQVSYYAGAGVERALNAASAGSQDFRNVRRRLLLVSRLVDVLVSRSWRENVVYDADVVRSRVVTLLEELPDADGAEMAVIAEIMADRAEGDIPDRDDIAYFVDYRDCAAAALHEKIQSLVADGVTDFSLSNLRALSSSGGGKDGRGSEGDGDEDEDEDGAAAAAGGDDEEQFIDVSQIGYEECEGLPIKRSRLR